MCFGAWIHALGKCETIDGVIHINGDPVVPNGVPVQATGVKHQFR